eukprot:CAMPEP_0114111616 /NCGR_PEP_ID=MMETSP0043_2-20121206/1950_1 /TAXON_ID=464988 /ORGANISM="Hemiselmis andersenii, Strain CCMP644" /LENGTH=90 /DNA_ID=CAMNT_0001203663 /DNA_START=60 /DNA_END=329 /DNA_ORIENTATION=+
MLTWQEGEEKRDLIRQQIGTLKRRKWGGEDGWRAGKTIRSSVIGFDTCPHPGREKIQAAAVDASRMSQRKEEVEKGGCFRSVTPLRGLWH